jgi:hypothetical protein
MKKADGLREAKKGSVGRDLTMLKKAKKGR